MQCQALLSARLPARIPDLDRGVGLCTRRHEEQSKERNRRCEACGISVMLLDAGGRQAAGARLRLYPTLCGATDPGRSQWDVSVVPPHYRIDRARPEDLALLPAIERAAARLLRGHAPESVLDKATDLDTFADAARHGRLWVALDGDAPVGFALVEMLADDLPHLAEVDVEPAHGRRGLGTALVRAACEWAGATGFSMLTLTTFRAVPWNLPFYARLGFVEIPRDRLRPELAALVSDEAARGLPPETRAVMAYRYVVGGWW